MFMCALNILLEVKLEFNLTIIQIKGAHCQIHVQEKHRYINMHFWGVQYNEHLTVTNIPVPHFSF